MSQTLYKVVFHNGEQTYEVYAQQISQGGLLGFVEIEELVFGEHSSLLIDPAEEKLQAEFSGVKRTYIPMHAVIRIDEVAKRGKAKIVEPSSSASKNNVTPFPIYTPNPDNPNGSGH